PRAGRPAKRFQRGWRRAQSGGRRCRSHCRRDARDSPHNPSQGDRNRRRGTRSAYRPRRQARHVRRLVADCQEHVNFARRELAIVAFVAFDVRCLNVVECKVSALLITKFAHPPEEICIMWDLSGLHTDKVLAWSLIVPTGRACSNPRMDRRAYFNFAAAVPTVGFVNGATDLNPINAAALEGYAET